MGDQRLYNKNRMFLSSTSMLCPLGTKMKLIHQNGRPKLGPIMSPVLRSSLSKLTWPYYFILTVRFHYIYKEGVNAIPQWVNRRSCRHFDSVSATLNATAQYGTSFNCCKSRHLSSGKCLRLYVLLVIFLDFGDCFSPLNARTWLS